MLLETLQDNLRGCGCGCSGSGRCGGGRKGAGNENENVNNLVVNFGTQDVNSRNSMPRRSSIMAVERGVAPAVVIERPTTSNVIERRVAAPLPENQPETPPARTVTQPARRSVYPGYWNRAEEPQRPARYEGWQ